MTVLLFLIAAFLLASPILLAVFSRYQIQLEKLQFWVMVSAGTAWIISCVFLALNPDRSLNPIWNAGAGLLPSLAFSLDRISGSLILAVSGVIFYLTLARQDSPRENALLTGLGGLSVLALAADSAYALALAWTALGLARYWIWFSESKPESRPRTSTMMIVLGFIPPAVLVLLSLTGSRPRGSGFVTDWGPEAGLPLIAAGLVGLLAWFVQPAGSGGEEEENLARRFSSWIPGAVGLLLMIRGGTTLSGTPGGTILPLAAGVFFVLVSLAALLFGQSEKLWVLGGGLLAASAALLGLPLAGLSWGIVFMIPGSLWWQARSQGQIPLAALVVAVLGLLPLPYLPAWTGVPLFSSGIPGYLLGAGGGLMLGGAAVIFLKDRRKEHGGPGSLKLVETLGSGVLLVSLVLIAFRIGLWDASRGLLSRPIGIWLPALLLLLALMLGNWIPLRRGKRIEQILRRWFEILQAALAAVLRLLERLINFLTRTLEGDGGLIWALLLGILIMTLLSTWGGG